MASSIVPFPCSSAALRLLDRRCVKAWLLGLAVLSGTDNVRLELDAKGRPCVRLSWDQSKAGTFGLVIGDPKMETPAFGPGMYDEQRMELRPGVYFWYTES